MYIDNELVLSDAQAVTATAISANVIDLGDSKDLAVGERLYLVIKCDETATAAGAATVVFSLISDSVVGLASSPTTHFATAAIGKADLTLNAVVAKVALPLGVYERYLGLSYTVATGPLTAGKFSAFIVKDLDQYKAYPDAITIS